MLDNSPLYSIHCCLQSFYRLLSSHPVLVWLTEVWVFPIKKLSYQNNSCVISNQLDLMSILSFLFL